MFNNNPIENIMSGTLNNLRQFMEVDTVIGKPIPMEGRIIIPVSKVNLGFLVGGGEYNESLPKKSEQHPYATGSGAGVSVTPVGFLVVQGDGQKLIKIDDSSDDKWADLISLALNSVKGLKN